MLLANSPLFHRHFDVRSFYLNLLPKHSFPPCDYHRRPMAQPQSILGYFDDMNPGMTNGDLYTMAVKILLK